MFIESEVAKQSRYGEDAITAFNTAVDNGQARMAMSILVDIINTFAEKIDALESPAVEEKEIRPETAKEAVEVKAEQPKQELKQKAKDTTEA
jgi:hypothetical protein